MYGFICSLSFVAPTPAYAQDEKKDEEPKEEVAKPVGAASVGFMEKIMHFFTSVGITR